MTNEQIEKIKAACGSSEPSDGHDWVDEICGLLRVTRAQRDVAERACGNTWRLKQEVLERSVNAFLSWTLPESVCSDQCATLRGYPNRTGTNLLTATEAKQMFEHVFNAGGVERE